MDEESERVKAALAKMLLWCDHVQDKEHAEQVVDHILAAAAAMGYRLVRVL